MFYLFVINKKICDKIIIQQQQWTNGYSRFNEYEKIKLFLFNM